MSGRLIILPKKSYCPWKPENVQRVLRDEERHQREASQRSIDEESRTRQIALRGAAAASRGRHRHQPPQQQERTLQSPMAAGGEEDRNSRVSDGGLRHVNLFESEERAERALMERWEAKESGVVAPPLSSSSDPPSTGDHRHRRDQQHQKPFYLRDDPYSAAASASTSGTLRHGSHQQAYAEREERRKADLDPMASFRDGSESDGSHENIAAGDNDATRARMKKRRRGDRGFPLLECDDGVRRNGAPAVSTCTALVVRGTDNEDGNDSSCSSSSLSSSERARRQRRRQNKDDRKKKESRRRHKDRRKDRKKKSDKDRLAKGMDHEDGQRKKRPRCEG